MKINILQYLFMFIFLGSYLSYGKDNRAYFKPDNLAKLAQIRQNFIDYMSSEKSPILFEVISSPEEVILLDYPHFSTDAEGVHLLVQFDAKGNNRVVRMQCTLGAGTFERTTNRLGFPVGETIIKNLDIRLVKDCDLYKDPFSNVSLALSKSDYQTYAYYYENTIIPYVLKDESTQFKTFIGREDKLVSYFQFVSPDTDTTSKGAVLISIGRGDFAEKYFEMVYLLARQGYGPIYVLEHRGQGRSDRIKTLSATYIDKEKGVVESFDHYTDDLLHFTKNVINWNSFSKKYIIAHSTGATIVAGALIKSRDSSKGDLSISVQKQPLNADRIVLLSPFLEYTKGTIDKMRYQQMGMSFLNRPRISKTDEDLREQYRGSYSFATLDGDKDGFFNDMLVKLPWDEYTSDYGKYAFFEEYVASHDKIDDVQPTRHWVYSLDIALEKIKPELVKLHGYRNILLVFGGEDGRVGLDFLESIPTNENTIKVEKFTDAAHELHLENNSILKKLYSNIFGFFEEE